MNRKTYGITILLLYSILIYNCQENIKTPLYYSRYKFPADSATIFPDTIFYKNDHIHFSPIFTSDGQHIIWSFWAKIMEMKKEGFQWQAKQPICFFINENFREDGPYLSPDENKLFFYSKRSLQNPTIPKSDFDLWYAQKTAFGWEKPTPIGEPVNSTGNEIFPAVAANGNLYFVDFKIEKDASKSNMTLYRSQLKNGNYQDPEKLPPSINRDIYYSNPYIDPEEKFIIFGSNRPGGYGSGDLYISYQTSNNIWSEPQNLGSKINTPLFERFPRITPDGKFLFFVRFPYLGSSEGKIFWVSTRSFNSQMNTNTN